MGNRVDSETLHRSMKYKPPQPELTGNWPFSGPRDTPETFYTRRGPSPKSQLA